MVIASLQLLKENDFNENADSMSEKFFPFRFGTENKECIIMREKYTD